MSVVVYIFPKLVVNCSNFMLVHHQHHGHKKGEADNKDDGLSSSDAIIVGGVVTALKLR